MMDGWDGLRAMAQEPQELEEARQKQERKERAFFQLFSSDLGQEVLGYMREDTIEKSTLPARAVDGQAQTNFQNVREGENNLYRKIVAMMKKGQRHE